MNNAYKPDWMVILIVLLIALNMYLAVMALFIWIISNRWL